MSAYMEIYDKFKREIEEGVYKFGEKLPSKRDLAATMQTSVITIQHAYALLDEEGYIESRERSGYFVSYKANDFFRSKYTNIMPNRDIRTVPDVRTRKRDIRTAPDARTKRTGPLVQVRNQKNRPSGSGRTNITIPSSEETISFNIVSKTMRRVLLDYGEKIMIKSPNKGCDELRYEIQAYLARNRGINVSIDQIVIGSGAEYLYSLVAQLFEKDSIIAVEDPCYEKIRKVYEAEGHKLEYLKLGRDGILSEELNNTKAQILHVTPFHSYPSQITADVSKKYEYLSWAGEDRYIVEDNYDSELTVSRKMEDALFALARGKGVIYINTFSKTIAPSIRIGYMILPQNLLERFEEKLGFYSCTVPAFDQYVLAELLKSGDFERHINRIRRQRRKLIVFN